MDDQIESAKKAILSYYRRYAPSEQWADFERSLGLLIQMAALHGRINGVRELEAITLKMMGDTTEN